MGDPSDAGDAGAGTGPDPSNQNSTGSSTAAALDPGPESDRTRTGTASSSSKSSHLRSASTTKASPPTSLSVSPVIPTGIETVSESPPSRRSQETPETIADLASATTAPTTTIAAAEAGKGREEGSGGEGREEGAKEEEEVGAVQKAAATVDPSASTADTSSPSRAARATTPVSDPSAIVAALAQSPASRSHQNSDSREAEADSDAAMASYRPGLTARHGLLINHPNATPTMASSEIAAPTSPVTSAYTGSRITAMQYSSYPTNSAASLQHESYRASTMPNNSTSMPLPSMRTIDAMSHQRVSPPQTPHRSLHVNLNTALTASSSSHSYHTSHNSLPIPPTYMPSDSLGRYPSPPDPRLLGNRGAKKDIKRRTKTGCLTCRKRRIKCDETHPICNNCKKSRRDCLGYDPIFRIRPQVPGPHSNPQLQLAPTGQPTLPSSNTSNATTHSAIGGGHSVHHSYGNQPSTYASSPSATAPPSSSTAHTPSSYTSPVASNVTPSIKSEPGYDLSVSSEPLPRSLPIATNQDTAKSLDYQSYIGNSLQRAIRMKVHEIIDLMGPLPPPQQISHTEETFNEITRVYHEMYAGGLGAFLETTWYYFVDNGKMSFPRDANLIEHMATFLKILEAVKANDTTQMAYSGILETRIVWELACTAYQTPDRPAQSVRVAMPSEGDAVEARNRLRVVETLLCGECLPVNPLALPLADVDVNRTRQFEFWYSLAEFVKKRDSPDSLPAVKDRELALSRMRHLLDGRENRDVLYSIAVVRELAPMYGPSYGNSPSHLDESDPRNRLIVASKFLLDEAQASGGTTNVVRRFSDIASRAFVNPAVNVAARAG